MTFRLLSSHVSKSLCFTKKINFVNYNYLLKERSNYSFNFAKEYSNTNLIMTDNDCKRIKTGEITIGTHDGIFHCDEVLACYMLQQLPEYKNSKVIRTRNETILNECDIVVDVGGVFNKENNKFDHHQSSFNETFSSLKPEMGDKWDVKLSSAGLIYTHFGENIIRTVLKNKRNYDISDDCLKNIFRKVYEYFIREIDGIDNGVPMFDGEPRYNINTHLSARIARLNSVWNSSENFNVEEQFEKAKTLVGEEFLEEVFYYTFVWWPARSIVQNAIEQRLEVHSSGEILELSEFCPWKQHLFQLEIDNQIEGTPKYVIMENKKNDWRVICVPNKPSSFVCRKFIHKDYRGIRNEDLVKVSGISDANFVHATGFIGGCQSREGALMMAIQSLEGEFVD